MESRASERWEQSSDLPLWLLSVSRLDPSEDACWTCCSWFLCCYGTPLHFTPGVYLLCPGALLLLFTPPAPFPHPRLFYFLKTREVLWDGLFPYSHRKATVSIFSSCLWLVYAMLSKLWRCMEPYKQVFIISSKSFPGMMVHTFNPSTWGWRQKNQVFKVFLSYIVSCSLGYKNLCLKT